LSPSATASAPREWGGGDYIHSDLRGSNNSNRSGGNSHNASFNNGTAPDDDVGSIPDHGHNEIGNAFIAKFQKQRTGAAMDRGYTNSGAKSGTVSATANPSVIDIHFNFKVEVAKLFIEYMGKYWPDGGSWIDISQGFQNNCGSNKLPLPPGAKQYWKAKWKDEMGFSLSKVFVQTYCCDQIKWLATNPPTLTFMTPEERLKDYQSTNQAAPGPSADYYDPLDVPDLDEDAAPPPSKGATFSFGTGMSAAQSEPSFGIKRSRPMDDPRDPRDLRDPRDPRDPRLKATSSSSMDESKRMRMDLGAQGQPPPATSSMSMAVREYAYIFIYIYHSTYLSQGYFAHLYLLY
jgi:hypothetical protein